MVQRTHWLTKYTNNQCHAHSDMHSITWPAFIEPSLHQLDFFINLFMETFNSTPPPGTYNETSGNKGRSGNHPHIREIYT